MGMLQVLPDGACLGHSPLYRSIAQMPGLQFACIKQYTKYMIIDVISLLDNVCQNIYVAHSQQSWST